METIVGGLLFFLLPVLIPLLLVIGVIWFTKSSQEEVKMPSAEEIYDASEVSRKMRNIFNVKTFIGRLMMGAAIGVAVILFFLAVVVIFVVMEKVGGSTGGAGGIIGFIVVPSAFLLGLPWSFLLLDQVASKMLFLSIATGIFINGLIFGFVWGLAAKFQGKG